MGAVWLQLLKLNGETQCHSCVKKNLPAAKRLGADLLEFAVSESADVVSGGKKFETATKSVGRQTPGKLLGTGSRRTSGNRIVTTKLAKQISRSRRGIFTNYSH